MVAVNRPGGGGVLMHELLAQAKPDGYTLGVVPTGVLTRTPFLRKVKYDSEKDFTYILLFALWQYGLVVKADSPWKTLDEFLDYAKKEPRQGDLFHRRHRLGPVPGHGIPGPAGGHQVDPYPL